METPKFEKINQPEKEEEIILKVIIARHGPKLTAEGEKNAKAAYFDEHVRTGFNKMGIENEGGLVHVNSSNVKRAADTAEIHRKGLSPINSPQATKKAAVRPQVMHIFTMEK